MHGCKTTPCSFPNLFRKYTQGKLTAPLQQTASASGSCAEEKVLLWPSLIHASCDCPHSSRKHSCQAFMSSTTLMYAGNTVSQKSSRFLALAILLPPFLCFSWALGAGGIIRMCHLQLNMTKTFLPWTLNYCEPLYSPLLNIKGNFSDGDECLSN